MGTGRQAGGHPPRVVVQQGALLSEQALRLALHARQRAVDALLVRLQHLRGREGPGGEERCMAGRRGDRPG